jgi:hypothetical protein
MRHLILVNLLVIALDISLLSIRYANLFYLHGAYKPCVYGMKLRIEYAILNRLINSMKKRRSSSYEQDYHLQDSRNGGDGIRTSPETHLDARDRGSRTITVAGSARDSAVDGGLNGIAKTTEIDVQYSQRT